MAGLRSSVFTRDAIATAAGIAALIALHPTTVSAQSSGLVAAYSFNEGSGTTVTDVSGNSLNGTIVGATWTTDAKYGKALSFNGTSSYVDLGNPALLQLTGSMTVEAWIKAAANPSDDGQIVAKSNGSGWQLKTSPDTGSQTFGMQVTGPSGVSAQRYTTTIRSLGVWYHVAGVYDAAAGTLSLYLNGVLDNGTLRNAVATVQTNASVNVNIGRRTGGFYFNGIIDEVRIYNRALSATEVQTDMVTPVGGTPPPPDLTPPTISITAPVNGATVVGTTNITVNANDNVGVAQVQYLLDGSNLGTPVVSAPFTLQWNSATTTLGPHTLAGIARDFSNNATTSTTINITVANPTPSQVGQWSPVLNWPQTGLGIPLVGVHARLLPSGKVLTWSDYSDNSGAQLFDPTTNIFASKTFSPVSLFCSSQSFLGDGRLLVSGGIVGFADDVGPPQTETFDPVTETWTQGALMNIGRYYPTQTTLGDGRVIILGGTTTCVTCIADIPEIYDPVANRWTQMANSARLAMKYYPHSFVLPDGRVIVAGQDDSAVPTRVLDLNTQQWTTIDARIIDGHSSAMYAPGKIIKAGTATADSPGNTSAPTSYTLDMTGPAPSWQSAGSMAFPRSFLNLTVLPDGTVLATGGGTTTDPADHSKAVYEAEIWSPVSRTWTTMSRMQMPRQYHSVALLLPDARVLVAGSGRQNGRSQPDPADEPNSEIFSPPYMFKGARPVITTAPARLTYNAPFQVVTPDDARIASVSLIALSAVTHAFNENQRFVPLAFQHGAGTLTVQGPINGNTAPPGPYMLFLVDTNGVPSVAAMTRLPSPSEDTTPPTAPGNLVATASTGAANLTWSASSDNVGVAAYTIYRSTTSGFGPAPANQVGQTTSVNYVDTAISAAGTYYYLVTAQDARGNVSPPSNEASATVALDTTAPTVTMTGPPAGNVSGIVSVTASASDDVAVAGVQFLLDGTTPIGAEVTGSGPTYTYNWTTNTIANGPHTLSARARDGAGNSTVSAAVSVTVANIIPTNLVAAYNFNEGTGTTLTDLSGNNLNGTIVGATWTTSGKYGGALSFNGTTNYVDLGNPALLQLTGSMTIEAWIKAAANPADDGEIVAKSNGSGWQLKTTPDTGPVTFGVQVTSPSGVSAQRYSTTVRSLGTWYHVAGVYDATGAKLSTYVNGVLDNGTLKNAVPTQQSNAAVNANIGRRSGGFYFNGIIDEVRIYSRALTQTEIQTDMNTPIGVTTLTPDLTVTSTHTGSFTQGQTGAVYTLTVNNAGNGATSGAVTVVDTVPGGLIVTALSGPGWTCDAVAVSCTRSDGLAAGGTYPPITLTANVGTNTPSSVTNVVTVSGGGEANLANDTGSDTTTVLTAGPPLAPVFVTEAHFAIDQTTTGPNRATVSLNVSGANTLLLAAFHAELDGGDTNWVATNNGVTGTLLVNTDGYSGGAGNQRFRIWYWLNPPQGSNTVVVQNSYTGTNQMALSAVLFSNVLQAGPIGDVALDVSATRRNGETETVASTTYDLIVHVIADALASRGTLSPGEVSISVANDGKVKSPPAPEDDASLWLATKSRGGPSTTVASSGWPTTSVINGVAIALHGIGPDEVPPTVSVTAPSDGIVVNGTIGVAASASDDTGVAGVQLLLDGANLGAEIAGPGPYTLNWDTTTALNGPHAISARARDGAGNTAAAANVSVTVSNPDTTPPTVSMTSPVNGFVATGTVSVMASATDNQAMAGVQFLLDGNSLGLEVTGSGPTFTLLWDTTTAGNGPHVLSAIARDTSSNTAPATGVSLIVSNGDTTGPVVSVTSPPAGTVTGIVTVNVSATDNVAMAGVTFLLDGAALAPEVLGAGPTYTMNWNTTTIANGPHTLSARGRDVTGNVSLSSGVSVTVSNTVSNGLLASYSFNAGSGTTTVDSSGNGLTGKISGATWTTAGQYGNALSFNGTNNYVDLGNPTSLKGTGSMTWTAWVKATSTPKGDGDIVAKQNSTSGWQLKTTHDTGPQTFGVSVSGSAGLAQRYSITVRSLNVWYHVAGVYNATARTLDIYVNGVLDNGTLSGTIPTVQTLPNVNVNIGRRSNGFYFAGTIDEVRIYNRALSGAEIQTVMNAPLP